MGPGPRKAELFADVDVTGLGQRPGDELGVERDQQFRLATRAGLLCGMDAVTDRKWIIRRGNSSQRSIVLVLRAMVPARSDWLALASGAR